MNRRDFLRAVPGLALAALGLGTVAPATPGLADLVLEWVGQRYGWAETETWYDDAPAPSDAQEKPDGA